MRHVACVVGRDMHAGFCWWGGGDFKEGDRLEGQGVDGRIIVKLVVKNSVEWRRFMWLRRGTLGSVKCGRFLD